MSTFKIIKKGTNDFWHWFNNDAKKVAISSFAVVLEEVSQTFSIVYLNGANVPQQAVNVLDIEVIDETDASVVETFTNVIDLRARLIELGYTAYLIGGGIDNITGLIAEGTNVTITGDGTLASPYVISASGGGGGSQNLEQVLTIGDTAIDKELILDTADANGNKSSLTPYSLKTENKDTGEYSEVFDVGFYTDDLSNKSSLNPNGLNVTDVSSTSSISILKNLIRFIKSGFGGVTNISFANPSATQTLIIPNESGTISTKEYADAKVVAELASFKTANFIDFTSSGQTQLDAKVNKTDLDPLVKRRYFDDLEGFGAGVYANSIFFCSGNFEFEGNVFVFRNGVGATWARTTAEVGRGGIIRGGTGTTSAGLNLIQFRSIWLGTEDFISQTSVRLQTLSDATNRFNSTLTIGVSNVNSMRINYSDNLNSGKWQCESFSSSVSTLVDSGVSVAINTWYDLKVCRIGMICYYYINNVLVATISTNVPSGVEASIGASIAKTAGTTSRTCDFDYLKFFDL